MYRNVIVDQNISDFKLRLAFKPSQIKNLVVYKYSLFLPSPLKMTLIKPLFLNLICRFFSSDFYVTY
jgi:hypothetical protein